MKDVLLDVHGLCTGRCAFFRAQLLVNELVFVLIDALSILVLDQVLAYVFVEAFVCVPVEQHMIFSM